VTRRAASLDWQPLDAIGWDAAADAFTRCYEHYVVPVRATGAELAARCRAEGVDPSLSYVLRDNGGPAGVALVARRGRRARLAAFAIAPRLRGTGMARPALARLLSECDERGDDAIELEVFEHNVPAVRLYAGQGFRRVDRLFGFHLAPAPSAAGAETVERPLDEFADHLARDPVESLPWQLQPETLARLAAPWRVLAAGGASFALADLSHADAVAVRLVYTVPERRRRGHARALLAAIGKLAGGRPVVAPQLVPEALAPVALALGGTPAEHAQLRMLRQRP
jgi:GNAT superfamily N-acetyltransferase